MKDERFGRFNHYFLRFSLTLCLCLAVFLTGCAVEVESSDADEQDMAEPVLLDSPSDTFNSDSSSIFSYESIKKTIIRIIDAAVELADSHEGKTGETININSQIDVTASSGPYKIWSGNIYKVSSKVPSTSKKAVCYGSGPVSWWRENLRPSTWIRVPH